MRQQVEVDCLQQELASVNEQLRIVTARMKSIPARNRPRYGPPERMAIRELKAARGWSLRQTADNFLVTRATIASWVTRIDEQDDSLVQLREPVNKFPGLRALLRAATEDTLSHDGQSQDRRNALPCGTASRGASPGIAVGTAVSHQSSTTSGTNQEMPGDSERLADQLRCTGHIDEWH